MIGYHEERDMNKKDNMKKLTIINMYGNMYWPKSNEEYKNASHVKYIMMPNHKNDVCWHRIIEEFGFTPKCDKRQIATKIVDDIVDFDNMRLIWPVPYRKSDIIPKELFLCDVCDTHKDYINQLAEFYANAIFDFVEDDNIVVIDVSNIDGSNINNTTYHMVCSKCCQMLRQRYKKIYVVYLGTVMSLLNPKRGLVTEKEVRSYFPDCITDWSISEIICQEKQNFRLATQVIERAAEIHSIKFHEIVEQILSDQILLGEEKK